MGSGNCMNCPYQREMAVSDGTRIWLFGEYDFVNEGFDRWCKGKVKYHSRTHQMDKSTLGILCGLWAQNGISIREAECRLWSGLSSFKILKLKFLPLSLLSLRWTHWSQNWFGWNSLGNDHFVWSQQFLLLSSFRIPWLDPVTDKSSLVLQCICSPCNVLTQCNICSLGAQHSVVVIKKQN